MSLPRSPRALILYAVTLVILVGGEYFWASDLDSDPPAYFSGSGQSLGTDPGQYVHHARSKILYDDWDPFDYPRWTVYQHSLTSLVGYLIFLIAGVSTASASAAGVFLASAGLLFLLLGMLRHHRPWTIPIFALFFMANVTLMTHGRVSYLENGLLFWAALTFFVYSWWGDRLWGVIAAAVMAALAMLTGKLFGALLLPALVLTIRFRHGETKIKDSIAAVAGFFGSSILIALILYSGDITAAFGYVGEQSYGLRGFPDGLSSPQGFFEHLIGYGYRMRLYYLNPDLLGMVVTAGAMIVLLRRDDKEGSVLRWGTPALMFGLFWFALGWLGLSPLNYSPIRYALLFIPAAFVLIASVADLFLVDKSVRLRLVWPGWFAASILGLLLWVLTYHTVGNVFYFNQTIPPVTMLTWTTVVALPLTVAALFFLLRKRDIPINRNLILGGIVGLVAISVTVNVARVRRFHHMDHSFAIKEAAEDIKHILGPNAVLSGPYAPTLTMDNEVKSFIHLFGVASVDSTLFQRQPITHLAIDVSNAEEAIKAYPEIGQLTPITSYYIRDFEVQVFRIAELFGNPEAAKYEKSHYEVAVEYYLDSVYDSCLFEMKHHMLSHPDTKSPNLILGDIIWKQRRYEAAVTFMKKMADFYPTDWNIQYQTARMVQAVAIMTQSNDMMSLSRHYYDRAAFANRYRGNQAHKSYYDLLEAAGLGRGRPPGG